MATQKRAVDYLLEQGTGAGAVSTKPMFGEYGVYVDGKMIGSICGRSALLEAHGIWSPPCRAGVGGTTLPRG